MKTIQIGGSRFEILNEEEVNCGHDWRPYSQYTTVNPKQEYVVGYGRTPVSVAVIVGRKCFKCKLIETGIDVEGKKIDRAMQAAMQVPNESYPPVF